METLVAVRLSAHFTLGEMTRSQTAVRLSIDNDPGEDAVKSLTKLCKNILEPVRLLFGIPFSPSSGFRSIELNELIGGSTTSQHCFGEAVDFEIPGVPNIEVANWIRDNLIFDQLILEYYQYDDPAAGWIHVSCRSPEQRMEALTYDGIIYHPGLPMDE